MGDFFTPPMTIIPGMRIGLLGGSFNPAHDGHVHAAELALKTLKLDRVWFLVSPQNPLKSPHGMASLQVRMEGARKVAHDPRIVVTDIETQLGTNYTDATLAALKQRFPGVQFVWLMGSDNLVQMPRWRNWQAIFRLVPVAVIARPGTALSSRTSHAASLFGQAKFAADARFATRKTPAWTMLDAKRNNASATALRVGLG